MRDRALVGVLSAALIGGALAGIGSHRAAHDPTRAGPPPNVLLVVIDTLRADHVGSYGYPRATSRFLDGLAAVGTRFASARAPCSWTGASVASLLTGLPPIVHGVEHHSSSLPDAYATMPEAFQNAGYETVAFSANAAFVTPQTGFAQGFDRFDVLHGKQVAPGTANDVIWADQTMKQLVEVATADRVTETALAWLRGRPDPKRPFFAYLHYFDPHAGYYPPPAFADRFGVPADTPLRGPAQKMFMYQRMRDIGDTPQSDLDVLVRLYDAEIAFTDLQIGRVLLTLMAERVGPTVVVITSDHGEEFGEHGGLQHSRTLFDELLRVPLIIMGPGVPRGVTIETPVSLLDVWPILADVTGIPAAHHLPRVSLHALAARVDPGPSRRIFADLAVRWGIHRSAAIDAGSKLILDLDDAALLYDLEVDPAETSEISDEAPARTETLHALLRSRAADSRTSSARVAPMRFVVTDERRARLEALGYVE